MYMMFFVFELFLQFLNQFLLFFIDIAVVTDRQIEMLGTNKQ